MALTLSVEEIVEQSKNPLLGIAPDWERVRLGDIATIQNGAPFKSELFNNDGKGMPVIRIRDVGSDGTDTFYSGDYDPAYVVRGGDLLIGMDGDFNCARWKGPDALLNQRVCRIIPKNGKYEPRLMDFALPGYLKAINDVTSSVTVKHLSSRTVADIPLPLPPLPQQRRIVEAIELQLGRLDAAVARLQAAKARLKRYKQAVLKAGVEGTLLYTDIEEGELPRGWKVVPIEAVGQIVTGNTPSKSVAAYYGDEHPFYKPTDLDAGYETTGSTDGLTAAGLAEARALPAKSILVTCIGATIGKTGFIRTSGACNQQINAIVPNEQLVPEYGYFHCISPSFQKQIKDNASATTLPLLNKNRFKVLDFILPTKSDQLRIVKEVETRLAAVDETDSTLDAQLLQATRLRQAVLKRAFEGRLVAAETPVIPISDAKARQRRHFHRAVLSGEIVHQLHAEPTFGRVKHQKIFHLIEHIAGLVEIEGHYHREAAGPLDNKLIYANAKEMKKQKWYEEVKRSGKGFEYKALKNAGAHRTYYERYWNDKSGIIQGIIKKLRKADSEQCEIVSTVYAAWNDLLIWGKEPTPDAILNEILNHWNESKRKIAEVRWRAAINWIEEQGWEPRGFGKPTRQVA